MVIEEHARLEILLPNETEWRYISENDIIKDSLLLTSQCVNGNTFGFGCVSPAQLSVKFRLKSQNIGRYDVYGAKIILYSYFGSTPPDDDGKKGVFNVTSVTKNNGIFTVSASDNVCWLDNSAFGGEEDEYGNKVYKYLNKEHLSNWDAISVLGMIVGDIVGEDIKETLGFRLSLVPVNDPFRSQIPNACAKFTGYGIPQNSQGAYHERQVVLLSGEQSDNIRDYVAWLAEYMGGFAVADKNGNIEFRLFESPYYYKNLEMLDFSEFQQNTLEIAGFRIFLYSAKMIADDNYCNTFEMPNLKGSNGVSDGEISALQNQISNLNDLISSIQNGGGSLKITTLLTVQTTKNTKIYGISGVRTGMTEFFLLTKQPPKIRLSAMQKTAMLCGFQTLSGGVRTLQQCFPTVFN